MPSGNPTPRKYPSVTGIALAATMPRPGRPNSRKVAIRLGFALIPDSDRLEAGGLGKVGVVSICPVCHVGPDGLTCLLIRDPTFDRDPAFEPDIDGDRLEAGGLGDLDRGRQIRKAPRGDRQQPAINVLRQPVQSIASASVADRLDGIVVVEVEPARLLAGDPDAGQRCARVPVFHSADHGFRRFCRVTELGSIDKLKQPSLVSASPVDSDRIASPRQDADVPRRNHRCLNSKPDQPLAAYATYREPALGVGCRGWQSRPSRPEPSLQVELLNCLRPSVGLFADVEPCREIAILCLENLLLPDFRTGDRPALKVDHCSQNWDVIASQTDRQVSEVNPVRGR